jgi:RNA polymerase sigma factor (sigma-70 family)
LEASALTHASQRGLLARRSPLLKLQGDARLIAMARSGNSGAFETMVDRYQGRLLGFCRQMLGSTEDAEDVLQEVFVNAYRAMLADEREINLRPWLYRIARNRCLNHLRKPTADPQESMDLVPMVEAASTAEKVHNREEFRQLLSDVSKLPETQRSALLLREMDAMSYEEIAQAMETSVPSIKSLLVRARISLAEASQARQLTCGEVRLELAEAAEGLRKVTGPVRRHVRDCEECADFRSQIQSNDKVLAALFPAGPLLALKGFIAAKLGLGGAGASGTGAAAGGGAGAGAVSGAGAGAVSGGAVSSVGAALSSSGAAGGLGAIGGAIGTKAVAGVVTAAVLTAGAVEVNQHHLLAPAPEASTSAATHLRKEAVGPTLSSAQVAPATEPVEAAKVPAPPAVEPTAADQAHPAPTTPPSGEEGEQSTSTLVDGDTKPPGASLTGAAAPQAGQAGAPQTNSVVVVTFGESPPPAESTAPPAESSSPPPPTESSPPPPAETEPPPPPPPASSTETTSTSSETPPAETSQP